MAAGRGLRVAAGLSGLLMLAVPALAAPAAALVLTSVGVLLVIGGLVDWVGRRVPAGTLAAGIAVIQCAVWPPGTVGLAVEGLLILGYLLLLDGPVPRRRRAGRAVAARPGAHGDRGPGRHRRGAGRPGVAVDRVAVACPGWPGRGGDRVPDRRPAPAPPAALARALMTRPACACWPRKAVV